MSNPPSNTTESEVVLRVVVSNTDSFEITKDDFNIPKRECLFDRTAARIRSGDADVRDTLTIVAQRTRLRLGTKATGDDGQLFHDAWKKVLCPPDGDRVIYFELNEGFNIF